MRILVTGGCGFIGTNICLLAKKRGYDVIAFDSLIRKGTDENIKILEQAGVIVFRGDVRNWEDLAHCRTECGKPDAIIHLAGNPGIPWSISYPEYDFQVNAVGTFAVLEMSRRMSTPIPVIYASTNKVYSDLINTVPLKEKGQRYEWNQPRGGWIEGITEKGINEEFPTDGFGKYSHSPYGISKLAGDLYCQEYFHTFGVPTVINRMSCIYGYYQKGVADQGWIDHFVRQFVFSDEVKLDIYGNGRQVRDMLWGEDVAKLYLDELENINIAKGKIFNVGGGMENTCSLAEAILYLENLSGKKAQLTYHPWRIADQKIYISDTTKVKSFLGWRQEVNPQEGIKRMYEKYKNI